MNRANQIKFISSHLQVAGQQFTSGNLQFTGLFSRDRSYVYLDKPDSITPGTVIADPAGNRHIVTRIDLNLPRVWITAAPYSCSIYRASIGTRDSFGRPTATTPALIASNVALGTESGRFIASCLQDIRQGDSITFTDGTRYVVEGLLPVCNGIRPLILSSEQISPGRLSNL